MTRLANENKEKIENRRPYSLSDARDQTEPNRAGQGPATPTLSPGTIVKGKDETDVEPPEDRPTYGTLFL